MESVGNAKGLFWNILAGMIAGYITRYFDLKNMFVYETIILVLYGIFISLLLFYFFRGKKKPPTISDQLDQSKESKGIELRVKRDLPPTKAFSSSQDLIDRWGIDWINLSTLINGDCLPAYFDTGLPGDYQPIESIEYEGGYHHDKTQKEVIMSFYFKEADVNRVENILRHVRT